MMRLINNNGDPEKDNFVELIDFFYCREHLFIVTELLDKNLYDFDQRRKRKGLPAYYTKDKIRRISSQLLRALNCLHKMSIMHCDLKPENILFKSVENCEIKLIDFGSCCFMHDEPAFYMQTRPYRAPELLLGCEYDQKIDMWSLGCVLLELYTGVTLFECRSVQEILAKMIALFGPFPDWMVRSGKLTKTFFTPHLVPFHEVQKVMANPDGTHQHVVVELELLIPDISMSFDGFFKDEDPVFIDFIKKLLEINPIKR